MSTRHRPAAMLHRASIPCIIWAEDAIRQFGCRVLVSHLFLVVPDPIIAKMCLLGSGEYTEVHSSTCYHGEGLLSSAPCLISLQDGINDSLPIALLRASDWAYIHPLSLSREPQFPSLSTLLSSVLGTWLQEPYSRFSSRLSTWITSIYEARANPALVGPAKGGALEPYLTLTRMIPERIRQLHVDLVHERVFMLAYAAHIHYFAVAETVDQCAAPIDDTDPIIPPPFMEEIGKGNNPGFWYV